MEFPGPATSLLKLSLHLRPDPELLHIYEQFKRTGMSTHLHTNRPPLQTRSIYYLNRVTFLDARYCTNWSALTDYHAAPRVAERIQDRSLKFYIKYEMVPESLLGLLSRFFFPECWYYKPKGWRLAVVVLVIRRANLCRAIGTHLIYCAHTFLYALAPSLYLLLSGLWSRPRKRSLFTGSSHTSKSNKWKSN